ncbi:DUF4397 domain-containing protein [Pseudonocardia alni]|uniref:DUF4397 domain-containing protein n=1 Tax=Pseudonocardia alni TaxID=33907 RepID=UPI00386BC6C1
MIGATLLGGGLLLATAPMAVAQDTGSVRVVHGIPGQPVDVYVDGERALDDFEPATVAGPVDLPAGAREVAVFPADAPDASGTPLLEGSADVAAGASATLVAHLDEQGQPALTPFVDDLSTVPAGQARLVVRHTAAAPAVDVLAGGAPLLTGLSNPGEASATAPAGTVSAAVAASGTTDPVIGPADLTLPEGSATFVHAIGSLDEGSLDLVTFTVDGLHGSPSGVPSGAPSGAPYEATPGWAPAAIGVLGAGVLGAAVLLRRRGARS